MEWLVKKSCCNKQDNRHVLMLCDAGGAIKMIAEVKSDFAVKVGDLLSPLQNALYCINREKLHTVKVLSASSYSPMSGNGSVKWQGKLSNVVLSWAGKSASTRS
ncbi:polymyxin B resistance protein PmrD [Escherichia coli]|nr:polymyxin B resistance protein PmrD [Escherichia coli]STF38138.1 polymyxin B resistance protein PmrD [Escherichia coli]